MWIMGPGFPLETLRLLVAAGSAESLAHLNINVTDFSIVRDTHLECGVCVPVAADALETDLLVGLPKIKAHNQMYLACAVKNRFGTIKVMKEVSTV